MMKFESFTKLEPEILFLEKAELGFKAADFQKVVTLFVGGNLPQHLETQNIELYKILLII